MNDIITLSKQTIELSVLVNRLDHFLLSTENINSILEFLTHLVKTHTISIFNINRLIRLFKYNTTFLVENKQKCGYFTKDNTQSCKISVNWGNRDWNVKNTTIRFNQPSDLFNSQISSLIRGFDDFINPITNDNTLTIKTIDDKQMSIINRISTFYGLKKHIQDKDKDISDFDILVASSFTEIKPIIEQFQSAFESTKTGYVLLEPIPGKNNAETIAFRSPALQSEFKRLFRENPDKQLVIWKDGEYHYLNSVGLDMEIALGSQTTYKEKYQMYKSAISSNKGHHTQYLIFGLGLFHNRPEQLIADSLKTKVQYAIPSLEEIERVRLSAKKIDKYVDSFMLKDHSINSYLKSVDDYCDRWIDIINDNPTLVYEETKVICKIEDCERNTMKSFTRCKAHLTELDNNN